MAANRAERERRFATGESLASQAIARDDKSADAHFALFCNRGEVMRLDGAADAERASVLAAIRAKFELSDEEAATLVTLAEDEARESVGYYQFTSLINARFSAQQKARIVELMWQVAYADATLSAHEQHVIRKVADLLYVPHGDYIAAKRRARGAT